MALALKTQGHTVYDFTDPTCRKTPEIPPEKYPEPFDPAKQSYEDYLDKPEWRAAVIENRAALDRCDVMVLLLPCGNDGHADWAYAVGRGKRSVVVGYPKPGDRSPTHMWADTILETQTGVLAWLQLIGG